MYQLKGVTAVFKVLRRVVSLFDAASIATFGAIF